MRELARMDRKDTILLVDDEKMIKQRLKDAICKDFDILEASNGLEALKVRSANSDKVAVIVLDLVMPVMDGLQFMETFRRYREYDNIPVIVATSNEDWHTEQRCLEAGVWDFVMKPYNPDLLRFRIKNVIDRSRMIMVERDTVTGLYTKYKFYRAVHSILSEET
ncbi:MAG: response regulator, partial [Lachnospiraceae bacterium]|nr:response regulator [Lachnospiraceae bacterium]